MVKLLLMKAPILVPPTDGEPLLLYVAATTQVVSAAQVVEREEEGMPSKYSALRTSSVRSYPTRRPITPKSRSFCTLSSSPGGSYATTSSHIQ